MSRPSRAHTAPSHTPTHVAGVLVTDARGGVLLLRRANPAQWETPGGKVEDGESAHAAATREAHEELGADVEITGEPVRLEFSRTTAPGESKSWEFDLHPARLRGPVRLGEPEIFTEVRFWRIPELLASGQPLSQNVRAALQAGVL